MSEAALHPVFPISSTLDKDIVDVSLNDRKEDLNEKAEATDVTSPVKGTAQVYADDDILQHERQYPVVTRREILAYYLYYNGDNGVAPNGYCSTQFQNLATQAGYDLSLGPGSNCDNASSATCMLPWSGGVKSVSSIVLIANGLSFMFMTLIFTTIGSAADYRDFARWLLLALTIVCWASSFGFLGVTIGSQWQSAMALFMLGYITYGATLVFYAALFPRIARNTQVARDLQVKFENGEISKEEYEKQDSLERNNISNISTVHSNWGYLITLALNLSLLLPLASSNQVNNYVIALTTGYWVITALPWFILNRKRPGPPLPQGTNYFTIGWIQLFKAFKEINKLPYTFIYLLAFFFLADGLNTTGTLVGICQNASISFSFLESTYIGLTQAATSIISCYAFWYLQRRVNVSTKKMFIVLNVATILIPLWGMVGIWTTKIGFYHKWEFYLYNVFFGLFQAPYYAYSQTMMSEVTPPGFEGLFFGLFGLTNRASSIIGPNVVAAIIDSTNSNQKGFPFLFAICTVASLIIWFAVDMERGRSDAVSWANAKREENKVRAGLTQ